MKNLKLMLALAILVFATTAGFSQQTKKSEINSPSDKLSRKEAQRGQPEAVKEMQEERGIGQARPERKKGKKAANDGIDKDRKKGKKSWQKGKKQAVKREKAADQEKTIPAKDGRYPQKEDKVMRPTKKEEGVAPAKRRSRKGQ